MIPPYFFRSMAFNFLFYLLTAVSCVLLLPTLLLPRKFYLAVVHGFVYTTAFLEKYILGLTYEIRGKEHLPVTGSYLIAAKHQSAYETTKLHILFKDPAIVLKQELLKIPLWGWYLAKSDVIAIDRSTPKSAVLSIQNGAKRMAAQGRPVVIFPQGTRVFVQTLVEQKPYKIGIVRLQEATNLPIIPMALNTGVFWPRNSIFKKPGRVIFEFLPPIPPGGEASAVLAKIQNDVENKSIALIKEGYESIPKPRKAGMLYAILFVLFSVTWTVNWFVAASITRDAVTHFLGDTQANPDFNGSVFVSPQISGFPFRITLTFGLQKIIHQGNTFEVSSIEAKSWPFFGFPITVITGPLTIQSQGWSAPILYDEFRSKFLLSEDTLNIVYARLRKLDFEGVTSGTIVMSAPYPKLDLLLNVKNHQSLIGALVHSKAIKQKDAAIAAMTLEALKGEDGVTLQLTTQDRNIYLGPLRVYQFPDAGVHPALLEDGTESSIATKRQKPVP